MSYYERVIYTTLCDLHRHNRHPVATQVLAGLLGKNDRTIRYALARLEASRIVVRKGQRGGWMPMRQMASA